MTMEYIRKTYSVPARRGGRIEYTGGRTPLYGTIKSARGARLSVLLDGSKHPLLYHPTWQVRYLTPTEQEKP